jgi:solute carrier family 25 (mitochondrial S-adenosylmethionine transporter), member 26
MNEFFAGAAAGLAVDTSLFPVDTIKTRLQSSQGFLKAGGFKSIYSGMSSTILGSAPSSAIFFSIYSFIKKDYSPVLAASVGEIGACVIRVPTEILKQRLQIGSYPSLMYGIREILKTDGAKGFYRGFRMTVFRDVPFASIQFPLYEMMKNYVLSDSNSKELPFYKAAGCGMVAGGIAAGLTTPLDVIKTRIMLSDKVLNLLT